MNKNFMYFNIKNNTNLLPEIKKVVLDFCNTYPINFDKQNYQISLVNEKINEQSLEDWYKITTYKYLHFFGRVYLDNEVKETLIINGEEYKHVGTKNTGILIVNGLEINSAAKDANVIDFYIAPSKSINNFDPSAWNML